MKAIYSLILSASVISFITAQAENRPNPGTEEAFPSTFTLFSLDQEPLALNTANLVAAVSAPHEQGLNEEFDAEIDDLVAEEEKTDAEEEELLELADLLSEEQASNEDLAALIDEDLDFVIAPKAEENKEIATAYESPSYESSMQSSLLDKGMEISLIPPQEENTQLDSEAEKTETATLLSDAENTQLAASEITVEDRGFQNDAEAVLEEQTELSLITPAEQNASSAESQEESAIAAIDETLEQAFASSTNENLEAADEVLAKIQVSPSLEEGTFISMPEAALESDSNNDLYVSTPQENIPPVLSSEQNSFDIDSISQNSHHEISIPEDVSLAAGLISEESTVLSTLSEESQNTIDAFIEQSKETSLISSDVLVADNKSLSAQAPKKSKVAVPLSIDTDSNVLLHKLKDNDKGTLKKAHADIDPTALISEEEMAEYEAADSLDEDMGSLAAYATPQMTQNLGLKETKGSQFFTVDLHKAFSGSPAIYSLLLVMSIGALGIWSYNLLTLRQSSQTSETLLKNIRSKLIGNQYDEALSLCMQQDSFFCRMMISGISSRKFGPQVMVDAMKAEGKRATVSFWQRMSLLNDIAIIAPMLGLLGTVLGMFYAFYDLNRSTESVATLFDGLGISVGTTVAGLIVAIIALILQSIGKYRLVKVLARVENEAHSMASMIDSKVSIFQDR